MTAKRRIYADKMALMNAGALVVALVYARASQDHKKQEKSVGDQLDLGKGEVGRFGWTARAGHEKARDRYGVSTPRGER